MTLLIRNGHVIRWDAQNHVEQLAKHHLLIEDNKIISATGCDTRLVAASGNLNASNPPREEKTELAPVTLQVAYSPYTIVSYVAYTPNTLILL